MAVVVGAAPLRRARPGPITPIHRAPLTSWRECWPMNRSSTRSWGPTDFGSTTPTVRCPGGRRETCIRPECMPQIANAMEAATTAATTARCGARLADDRPGAARSIDEAVVEFDNASAAQAVVAATVQSWRACADALLTITSTSRAPERWSMRSPRVVNGVQVVDADDPDSTPSTGAGAPRMRCARPTTW